MNPIIRRLAIASTLAAVLAPAALAGGANAVVSGPFKDGTYLVHTYHCQNPASMRVSAWAEGIVDGKRQTVPVRVERTREKGVYRFHRSWPGHGTWAIRMELGSGRLPVTVTALDEKGSVKTNQLIWEGDGRKECVAILNGDDPR